MRSLGLILARGGSTGIPRKNLVDLGGKPLIAWTIDAALASDLDLLYVSTDDREIAKVATRYGAAVINRPTRLAQGESGSAYRAELHAMNALKMDGIEPDAFMRLQPTSPFRSAGDINAALTMLRQIGCGAVQSVVSAPKHPFLSVTYTEPAKRRGYPTFGDRYKASRQKYPESRMMNGAIYAAWEEYWRKNFGYDGPATYYMEMGPFASWDIDDEFDLRVARALIA